MQFLPLGVSVSGTSLASFLFSSAPLPKICLKIDLPAPLVPMQCADIVMNGVVSSAYIQEMTEKIFRTMDDIAKGKDVSL